MTEALRGTARSGRGPTSRGSDRSLPATVPLLAVLGMVAVALGAALAVNGIVSAERSAAREEAHASAEREAARVQSRLTSLEALMAKVEPAACTRRGLPVAATLDLEDETPVPISCVVRTADGLATPPVPAGLEQLLADDAVAAALARASDRAQVVLSPPAHGTARSVLAAPLFRSAPGLDHRPSDDRLATAERELAGYLVAVLDVGTLVDSTGRSWQVTDGGTVLSGPPQLDGPTATADIAALDRRWRISTPVDQPSWWQPEVASVATLAALGVVLLGLADRRRRAELTHQADEARRAEARAAVVASLAGIVQQSQDLDEILPALAVRLSDELGLAGLSLAVSVGSGLDREVFVHGVPPDRSVPPVGSGPEHVPARGTLAVDLHRADRSIAVLRVVAGSALDARAIEVVRLAGEMVTSTIVAARSIEQQQEAVRRLESLDELKTTFLGVASHELRTPATAISGLASLLAQRWDDLPEDDKRTFADRIATNANALNTLVQDLLDFARLERGDLRLSSGPIDLSTTVLGLLERLDSVWTDHQVAPNVDPGVEIVGDANAIERIVTNLVSNAVKFSPPGETVKVTVLRDGGRAMLLVDDAGPGVPEYERDRIFVRFFRGTDDAVVRTRGVGIGLSVVQDFVSQMGGAVRVEDAPTGGARFVVEFPVHDRVVEEISDAATT